MSKNNRNEVAEDEAPVEQAESTETTVDNGIHAKAKIKDKETGEVTGEASATCTYDFGTDIDSAVALFGADVVFNNFRQNAVISAQSRMRSLMNQGLSGDELQAKISEWKPGIKTLTRKSPVDKLKDLLSGRSPEEIAALIAAAGIGE